MKALNKKLLRDLWRLKSQAVAIAFVVACGIATYVMASTAFTSLLDARDSYYDRYRFADVFAHAKRAPMSLQARLQAIEGVKRVYPRIRFGVNLDVPGLSEPASGVIVSIPDAGEPPLNDVFLKRGRMIASGETDAVLIGEAFAVANKLEPGDVIGAIINGRKRWLNVAGVALSPEFVYTLSPGNLIPDDRRFGVMWMNHRALEAATGLDGAFNDLAVSLVAGANAQQVMDEINLLLAPYGGVDAYDHKSHLSAWFVNNELTQLSVSAFIVPLIFLSVAAFLLNIVLARLVATEREQIGMLKALGYSNSSLGIHYLGFAVFVVALGAVLGAWLGIETGQGLLNIYTQYFRFPDLQYIFDETVLIKGTLVSLLAAVLGTVASLRRISRLPPAEAMRPAPPVAYRPSVLERLGVHRFFSTPTRMIVRHLERRPLRAFITVLGISISAAIMVSVTFAIDAIDHMIDVQYSVISREDVDVTFAEPRSVRAVDDMAHLPGVLRVEPYRMVTARLRNGHTSHRTSVMGIARNSDLKRVIDAKLRNVDVPEQGLLLSAALARILKAEAGDILRLELLEGRRVVRDVPVVRIVEEYIGASAYMNLEALNALMGDGPMMSGAALVTDLYSDPALYERVKNIPMIAGSVLKGALIKNVRETMTESIVVTMVFNTLFAGLIAFGVLYNTARISLSERARELGSMRVLGFSKEEVAAVLLGELALLVVLAIPLGLWLGYYMAYAMSLSMDTELFRLPLVISPRTWAMSALVVVAAAVLSGVQVWFRLKNIDIVNVLKARE